MVSTWYPKHSEDLSGCFFREQALALQSQSIKVGAIGAYQRPLSKPFKALLGSNKIECEDDEGISTFRRSSLNFPPRWLPGTYQRTEALVSSMFEAYVKKAGTPDLVHVQSSFYAGSAAMQLYEAYGVPYLVQEHSSLWHTADIGKWEHELQAEIFDKAARRFSVSPHLSKKIVKVLGRDPEFVGVVPNSVRQEFLEAATISRDTESFQFFHLSSLDVNKNVKSIIRAFALRFRGMVGHHLVIGGDGPERQRLVALAKDLGVAHQVGFAGRLTRQQVISEMQRSDAFVLSSKVETFGVVVIEALAMGLPVVATRCGGPEDILDKSTGIIVVADNDEQLAEAMFAVSNGRDRWDRATLRRICSERYSPKQIARQWKAIYSDLLDRPRQ